MALPSGSGYATADVSNPGSALTDFTVLVDLSLLPQSWWDAVDTTDPTKGRAAKGTGTELASDWISFDGASQTGYVRVKWTGTLSATGTETIRIYPPQTANASYLPAGTYGQYNAYDSDWAGYWPSGGGQDRTANANDGTTSGGVVVGGVAGPTGAATAYDGTDDRVEVPMTAGLASAITGASPRTMRGMVKVGAYDDRGGVWGLGAEQEHQDFSLELTNTSGQLKNNHWFDDLSFTIPTDPLGWHQLATRYDGSEAVALVDGAERGSITVALDTSPNQPISFGFSREWAAVTLSHLAADASARPAAWLAHEHAQTTGQAAFWGTWSWSTGGTEPVTVTESLAVSAIAQIAATDRTAATEALSSTASAATALTDSGLTSESLSAPATATSSLADTSAAQETISTSAATDTSATEIGNATETLAAHATTHGAIIEKGAASEFLAASAQVATSITETIGNAVTEALSVVVGAAASLTEVGAANESLTTGTAVTTSAGESASAKEQIEAHARATVSATEKISIREQIQATVQATAALTEKASTTEKVSLAASAAAMITEQVGALAVRRASEVGRNSARLLSRAYNRAVLLARPHNDAEKK